MPALGIGQPQVKVGGLAGGIGINIAAVKEKNKEQGTDFQDDFMAKFDEFSESWREACKHMRKL